MSDDYKDIINLPHHVSSKRPQMPMLDRAESGISLLTASSPFS